MLVEHIHLVVLVSLSEFRSSQTPTVADLETCCQLWRSDIFTAFCIHCSKKQNCLIFCFGWKMFKSLLKFMYLFRTVYCLDLRHVEMLVHISHVFLYCDYLSCYVFGGKTLQSEAEKSFIQKDFSPLFTPTQEADVVKVYQLIIPQLSLKLLITSWIHYFQKEALLGCGTATGAQWENR